MEYLQTEKKELAEKSGTGSSEYRLKQLDIEEADLTYAKSVRDLENNLEKTERSLKETQEQIRQGTITAEHSGYFYLASEVAEDTYVQRGKTVCYITKKDSLVFTTSYLDEATLKNCTLFALIHGSSYEVSVIPLSAEERSALSFTEERDRSRFQFSSGLDLSSVSPGDSGFLIVNGSFSEEVLQVPIQALFSDSSGNYVYVMKDGTKTRQDVTVGTSNGIVTVISEGLSEGDTVYLPPSAKSDTSSKTYTAALDSISIEKESKASLVYPLETPVRYPGQEAAFVSSSIKNGQTIEAGQVLMTVTSKTNPIDLEELELELTRLKENLEDEILIRNNDLTVLKERRNSASDSFEYQKLQLEIQRSNLDLEYYIACQNRQIAIKEQELQKAEEAISTVEITAPVSGIVTDLLILEEGDLIENNTRICSISDSSLCMVKSPSCYFPFGSEVQICGNRMGQELKIDSLITGSSSVEAADTDKFSSYLTPSNSTIDLTTIENLSVVGKTIDLEDVLLIPTKAVHTDTSGDFVYVQTAGGESRKQYLNAYCIDSEWTWAVCGIDEGQTLILN